MTTLSQLVKMTIVDDDDNKTMELLPDHPTKTVAILDDQVALVCEMTEEVFDSKRIDENDDNYNSKNESLKQKIAAIQAKIEAVRRERIQMEIETQFLQQWNEFYMGRMYAKSYQMCGKLNIVKSRAVLGPIFNVLGHLTC